MERTLLVYDIITSGCTASIFSENGTLLAAHTIPLEMQFSENYAQQNAEDWWDAVVLATHHVTRTQDLSSIVAISFSDQVQVCLCVDKEGVPLRPAITWSDTRSLEVEDFIGNIIGEEAYYKLTAQPNVPSSSIRKLTWIREKEPEIFAKTYKMLGCKDYIIFKMTGVFSTDDSDAAGTGCYDVHKLCWSKPILDATSISIELLPDVYRSTDMVGRLTEEAAKILKLNPGVPIISGAGDFTTATIGAGCFKEGDTYMNLGSSSWLATCSKKPMSNQSMTLINVLHADGEHFIPLANMQEAGVVFKWLKNAMFSQGIVEPYRNVYPYENMDHALKQSPVGANGLLCFPFYLGSSSSYKSDLACGGFIGLRDYHTREDMMRAAIEGATIALDLVLQTFKEDLNINRVIVEGISSIEDGWIQIIADVFNMPVDVVDMKTTVDSIGAAIIAGVGVGLFNEMNVVDRFRSIRCVFEPNLSNQSIYDRYKEAYVHGLAGIERVMNVLNR
ncbi:MAG: FGGY family carbohydrate kinase [Eubacteriales bacterium]|nr:FGGY family carbohydrate kinase [Eubacteriales bacterium]